jgi:vancomycin resistance protein YoaR
MGIKELIGVGHTSFFGSPTNRIHNIKTGIAKLNGALIAPNEEFSINARLGPVDDSTGYKKELVITKKGTIPEYGGGLCQVSTTMYRAAIFSGLKITARAAHSYAVTYYSQVLGHGLDATIYSGGQDLKFINDTPGYILIQGYVENNHAYFKFYGTSDGRTITMDGPYLANYVYPSKDIIYENSTEIPVGTTKLVEKRNTGFEATWYRTITRPDGTQEKEEIFSHYKATQERYWVGVPEGTAIPAGPEIPVPLP